MSDTKIPIRNVVLLGHSHSGKTQLAEALLVAGGAIVKPGKVTEGTTISDYNSDEKERKLSINLSLLHFEKDGINLTGGRNQHEREQIEKLQNRTGFNLEKYKGNKRTMLRNCVLPELGLHIFQEALREQTLL